MMLTYNEHMRWAKARALEYHHEGDLAGAVTSMLSDLSKHPETRPIGRTLGPLGLNAVLEGGDAVRRWIEGFADGTEGKPVPPKDWPQ